jgi:uncharacterized protein YndB with AHSA1/START domain
MASIRLEMTLRTSPARAWDAIRDVGAIHTRLAPDFVTDVTMEGDARIVSFANGMTAKELIVDVDDAGLRLVWAVVEGRLEHHNGSIQLFPEGAKCRLVWIADILPDELAPAIRGMMKQGMDAMKKTLEAA